MLKLQPQPQLLIYFVEVMSITFAQFKTAATACTSSWDSSQPHSVVVNDSRFTTDDSVIIDGMLSCEEEEEQLIVLLMLPCLSVGRENTSHAGAYLLHRVCRFS